MYDAHLEIFKRALLTNTRLGTDPHNFDASVEIVTEEINLESEIILLEMDDQTDGERMRIKGFKAGTNPLEIWQRRRMLPLPQERGRTMQTNALFSRVARISNPVPTVLSTVTTPDSAVTNLIRLTRT